MSKLLILTCFFLTVLASANKRIDLISVLGGPGTGKGTQCSKLKETFGFQHLSLGDLFRSQLKNDGVYANQIRDFVNSGQFVPSEIGVKLIANQLQKLEDGSTVLLDGFPRNKQNIETWNSINGDNYKLNTYLYLDCPLEEMQARLIERGKISGRSDDNHETIRNRLQLFLAQTQQVIDSISECSECTVIKIDTHDQMQSVWKRVYGKFVELGYKPISNTEL